MKAAFQIGERVVLEDVQPRELGPDQVRVRVEACGVCGTDLHVQPGPERKGGFGHEVAGEIIEMGAAMNGLALGQKVALDSSTPCGRCANCRNARQELCTKIQSFYGLKSFGMAEEMIAPGISAIPYDELDAPVACLQEPLGVAIDMMRLAEIGTDSNVLLIGPGPIGLMALALTKRTGPRRVFVGGHRNRRRMALAREWGADDVIDPANGPLIEYEFGCPIDRVLVTAPPCMLAPAFNVAAKGAIITFVGIEWGAGATCSFDANAFHFKKLQLRASFASPALFGALALQYLREGVVDGKALISGRFPLDEVPAAMEAARADDALKVVVEP